MEARAHEALFESRALLEALKDSGVGVWRWDLATDRVYWSAKTTALYGLSERVFLGDFDIFIARVHEADRAATIAGVQRALQDRTASFVLRHRANQPDGSLRWIESRGRVVLSRDGSPTGMTGIALDITEQKALEEQLTHAQKLEALARLAGSVAHDFNNLLTVMMGATELIAMEQEQDPDRNLEDLRRAQRMAAELTGSLLSFARRQPLLSQVVNLGNAVGRARGLMARGLGDKHELVLQCQDEDIFVAIDQSQFENALLNIALNARDAMPDGGTLTVSVTRKLLERNSPDCPADLSPGEYAVVEMADTGRGIASDALAHLFEPFFTTKGADGTGLGLATVHGILRRLGGTITASNRPSSGACFSMYLPTTDAQEAVEPTTGVRQVSG